jgi:hypothetical protein
MQAKICGGAMRNLSRSPDSFPNTDPPIVLGRFGDQPMVHGKLKPRLTWAQHRVVQALLAAGNEGLTKDQLDSHSGHSDARKILKRLHDSDSDWAGVIHMPGIPGCRYRIA